MKIKLKILLNMGNIKKKVTLVKTRNKKVANIKFLQNLSNRFHCLHPYMYCS